MKKLHIVNWLPAAGTLDQVFQQHNLSHENSIYCFEDDLSIGPLKWLESVAGSMNRNEYFKKISERLNEEYKILSKD